MAPARLTRPLDPIYQGSTWTQPIYVLDEDADGVQTPADLTGVEAVLSLSRLGIPTEPIRVTGDYLGDGLLLFSKADVGEAADGWDNHRYAIELTLDEESVISGEVTIVKGANAGGASGQMPGAVQVPGVATVVRAATGAVQIVRTDRVSVNTDADFIAFDPTGTDLTSLTLGDAIRELANREPTGPRPPEGFAFVTFNDSPIFVGEQPVIAEI